MNSKQPETIKMFGPALSGPARLVNRDVPVCDEQAYVRAGYKRGSVDEEAQQEVQPIKVMNLGSEELSLEGPEAAEPVEEKPAEDKPKPRRKKGQS